MSRYAMRRLNSNAWAWFALVLACCGLCFMETLDSNDNYETVLGAPPDTPRTPPRRIRGWVRAGGSRDTDITRVCDTAMLAPF
eukprot:3301240-Pyramimonas_sp.AAC.2